MPAPNHNAPDSWNKLQPPVARVLSQVIYFLVLVVLVFAPLTAGAVTLTGKGPIMIVVACAATLWIVALLAGREAQVVFTPMSAPILVGTTYVVIRYAMTDVEAVARPELLAVLSAALVFFLLINTIRHRWQVTLLVWTLVGVGVGLALAGFGQVLRGSHASALHTTAATGGFALPADYAVYLHLVFPLAAAFFLFSRRPLNERVALAFACLIITAALGLSRTRHYWAGWLASVLVLGAFLLRKRGWKFRWVLAGGVVSLVVIAAGWLAFAQLRPPSTDQLPLALTAAPTKPAAALGRHAWEVGRQRLWTGAGPGMLEWLQPFQSGPAAGSSAAGNEYLPLFADFGLVGVLIMLWCIGTFALVMIQQLALRASRYSASTPSNRFAFAVAGLAVFVAALVDAGLGGSLRAGANLLTLTGVMAAALTCGVHHHDDPEEKPPKLGQYSVLRLRGLARFVLVGGLAMLIALLVSRLYTTYPAYLLTQLAERKKDNLRWPEALALYERAWKLDGRNFAIDEALGDLYTIRATWNVRQANRLSTEALIWYDRALTLNTYAYDVLVKKARLCDLLADRDKAAEYLHQAVQAKPLIAAYHTELGLHCQRWHDLDAARLQFQRAHELDPTDPLPIYQLQQLAPPDP